MGLSLRIPRKPGLRLLCAVAILLLAACAGPGGEDVGEAGEGRADGPPTAEHLRVLHQRGLKARERNIDDAALSYFLEASDGGYGPASVAAGKLLATGFEGMPADLAEAARRYRMGLEQGAGYRAELPLGALYLAGKGVAQDAGEAERWFRRGALTIAALEGVVKQGEQTRSEGGAQQLITSLFHPHPVPAAFDEALAWARSLDGMEGAALYRASEAYQDGGAVADPVLAEALLEKAAEKGHPEAAYALARRTLDAGGERDDRAVAIDLLWRAAQGDLVIAQTELAEIYAEANRDPLDRQRAYYWLVRAERNGAAVSDALQDAASDLSEAQRQDVLQTLAQGEAYLP